MAREILCGIYCIENLIDGKKYIGQSKNIKRRFICHLSNLRKNKHGNIHLQRAWNKYEENSFKFDVIELCELNLLNEREIFYINYHRKFGRIYNLKEGGNQGAGHSKETKLKISRSRQKLSQQVIDNMREAQMSIPILQIDMSGNIVREWYGAREAAKELNMAQSCIWRCVNHIAGNYTYKSFIWLDKNEYENFNLDYYIKGSQVTNPAKKINQYDFDMNLIKTWNSAWGTLKYGFDSSAVIKCCKGKIKYHKGFIWRYEFDEKHGHVGTQNIVLN